MACVRKRKNKAGNDRWVVDFRDQNGRRRWRVFDTRKEADACLGDVIGKVKTGTFVDPATLPTFETVARHWLVSREDRAPQTYHFWRGQLELHLIPAFGRKRIDTVKPQDVQTFKTTKWNRDEKGRAGLARATVNQLLQTLRAIFDYAIDCEYIQRNPAGRVKGLRKERRGGVAVDAVDPRTVLSPEQAAAVIENAQAGLFRTFVKTALLTGCRSGELLALRWCDLDLDVGTLTVNHSLSWKPGEERGYGKSSAVLGPPKTESSRRTLELAPDLVRDLKEWFMRSRFKGEDAFVFSNSVGGPLHRAHLHKGLREACRAAGAPKASLHGLRHAFASIAIMAGAPVTQVAKLLGHKDPEITLKRYSHWFQDVSSRDAMATIAGAILRAPTRAALGSAS